MNQAGIDAIKKEMGYLEDNMYRYKLQQKASPGWVSGNDEPIGDIIAWHENELKKLREALNEAKQG